MWIIFLIMLIGILFLKIEVKFELKYLENDKSYNVYLYKFDITRFIRKSMKKTNKNDSNNKLDLQNFLNIFIGLLSKIKMLKRKPVFIVKNIVDIGVEDADITALLSVFLLNIICCLYGVISSYTNLKVKSIEVNPKYNRNYLKFYFQGILQIRIVQIIYISFLFITLGRRLYGTTSNRKLNEEYT